VDLEKQQRGSVLVLRINRPEARNALNPVVIAGIGRGLQEAQSDPDIRSVIITGTGDRAFCAGMDLRAFADGTGGPRDVEGTEAYMRFVREGIDKPVIGAANATAVAGGFELLIGCDLVVASKDAKFGIPEAKRGLFAAGGGTQLGRRIPIAVALELGLTGDLIDAERAYTLGLINRVVPAEQVLDEAMALAERIGQNGPLAVEVTKRLMRAAWSTSAEEAWKLQDQLHSVVFESQDAKEGALAFLEKRPLQWKGR
jgi:enoyl-CoA hydratase/carnithine racemase